MIAIAFLLQCVLLIEVIYSFEMISGRKGWNLRLPYLSRIHGSSADELPIGKTGPVAKLPIVQVFKSEELIGEFICGSDLAGSPQKLESFLNGISKLDSDKLGSNGGGSIDNIYSDEHFEDVLHRSDTYVVVKLYRQGCKKCEAFDPLYEKLSAAPQFSSLRWYQVDVSYLDTYMKSLKKRLAGGTQETIAGVLPDCRFCENTGFIECDQCKGVGYVIKGSLAVTCSKCVGYKKNRCPSCGGKCLKC